MKGELWGAIGILLAFVGVAIAGSEAMTAIQHGSMLPVLYAAGVALGALVALVAIGPQLVRS